MHLPIIRGLVLFVFLSAPFSVQADALDDEINAMVKDFQIHLSRLDPQKKYHVVVRFFVDADTGNPNRLTDEIERTLIGALIDRLGDRQNLVVLERRRLQDLDRELTFDTDGRMTWDKKMFEKFGAGFLITGTVSGYSDHARIRARMVDILTGAIVASAQSKIRFDEMDPLLSTHYTVQSVGQVPKHPQPSSPTKIVADKKWTEPLTNMEFVWVEGGCFKMGSNDGASDGKPVHEVCVDGFWMGKYEVTNAQFRRFRSGHSSKDYEGKNLNGNDQPVVHVSWEDAAAFARWLSDTSAQTYRLPTEAEWEYAARAMTTTAGYWGENPDDACRYANVADLTAKRSWSNWAIHNCDDGFAVSAPVGRFQPNAFGLHDMLGNVWEWCQDWYDSSYYANSPRNNPQGPSGGSGRVFRGGAWDVGPGYPPSASRGWGSPDSRRHFLGFRLLMTN
ncbi:MAG: hypothetical protein EOM25_06725 [Deltaproteobacteria bacterium]|nr:hypothetical protein [Deltaproteobacteria bacterium]